jgi:hypothetical protein
MSSIKCPKCGMVTWADAAVCKGCGSSFGKHREKTPAQKTRGDVTGAKRDARKAAMKKIAFGGAYAILYVIVLVVATLNGYEIRFNPIATVLGLTPIAWGLAGVLQFATGVPFEELSSRWDGLPGWKRGVIGITVFAASLVALGVVSVIIMVVVLNAKS